jgi:hypothetical protein
MVPRCWMRVGQHNYGLLRAITMQSLDEILEGTNRASDDIDNI